MGRVKAWKMKLEEEAFDDIINHEDFNSWIMAHPQCDEETLREYWDEFQSSNADPQ